MTIRTPICKLLLAALAAAFTFNVSAHDGDGDAAVGRETRTLLQRQALPDLAGKLGIMATVRYAPGQASVAHEHPGSVFAYVLDGEVVSQLEGAAAVTYKAGDSWYEPPHAGHLVSKNASATRPATLLVFLLANEGEAISRPR